MAEKSAPGPSRGTGPTLQRGKACLRCRKRKMRCDGTKPACQQCQRAKKGDLCEYDDGKGKTRTQVLRENIARLEARIKELEDPERTSSSVTLFDPHSFGYSEESSSSSAGSPSSLAFSQSQSPYPFGNTSPPPAMHTPPHQWLQKTESPIPFKGTAEVEVEELPVELKQSLLDIFLPHRQQVGFEINVERLRNSLHLPMEEQRHPVLMNAIYLWACYLSRPQSLGQHEPMYLSRALEYLDEALQNPSRVVDLIQGCCLISMYLLTNGRLLEGSYHASNAASMAMQWGLHRQVSEEPDTGECMETNFKLPPAQDAIERGERILAFWQVFVLDRCWSVVLQRPSTIQDGRDMMTAITVPWPQDMEDYEAGNLNTILDFPTVQSFLAHQMQLPGFAGGFSHLALRAKASALFESAVKLSATWNSPVALSETLDEETQALENTVIRFSSSLLPVHQLNATLAVDKHALIVIHTLAQAALVRLHYRFGETDPMRHEKCLQAARACVFIIRHIGDADYDYLDPIIGSCWGSASAVFTREITRMEAWSAVNTTETRAHVATIVSAMSKLSTKFPLLGNMLSHLFVGKARPQPSSLSCAGFQASRIQRAFGTI